MYATCSASDKSRHDLFDCDHMACGFMSYPVRRLIIQSVLMCECEMDEWMNVILCAHDVAVRCITIVQAVSATCWAAAGAAATVSRAATSAAAGTVDTAALATVASGTGASVVRKATCCAGWCMQQ